MQKHPIPPRLLKRFRLDFLDFLLFLLIALFVLAIGLVGLYRRVFPKQPFRLVMDATLAGLRATIGVASFLVLFTLLLGTGQVHDMLEGFQPKGLLLTHAENWASILVFLLALAVFGNSARLATIVMLVLNDYAPINNKRASIEQSERVVRHLPFIYQSGIYTIALGYYLLRNATFESVNTGLIVTINFVTVFLVGVVVHYLTAYLLLQGYGGLKKLAAWILPLAMPVTYATWPCKDASFRDLALKEQTRTLLKDRNRMPLHFLFSFLLVIIVTLLLVPYLGSLGPDDSLYMFLYRYVQTVPMLFLGLALWLVLFCAVEMWDVNWPVPVKLMLAVLVLTLSYLDNDHPATSMPAAQEVKLPKATEHFRRWLSYHHPGWDTSDCREPIPVLFINIEGGASRSGYWAVRVLDSLNNYMVAKGIGPLAHHVYSYSCVSGGNLGAHTFLALQDLEPSARKKAIDDSFLEKDMIFPVVYKFCLGEPVLWFTPWYSPRFDRAVSIERHLSLNMDETLKKYYPDPVDQKRYSWTQGFFSRYDASIDSMPVFMANAAEVESGRRAVLCNVEVPRRVLNPGAVYDILDEIPQYRPDVAGAIHFSARFPLVSPSARMEVPGQEGTIRHLVDGGVIENEGNLSTDELIRYLKEDSKLSNAFVPLVLNILVSSEKLAYEVDSTEDKTNPIRIAPNKLLNEISDVMLGIYNARGGHAYVAAAALRRYVTRIGGEKAEIDLMSKNLPLNWYISEHSRELVDTRLQVSFQRDTLGYTSRYLQFISYRLGAEEAPRLYKDIVPARPVFLAKQEFLQQQELKLNEKASVQKPKGK